jgi:hypothetical protein
MTLHLIYSSRLPARAERAGEEKHLSAAMKQIITLRRTRLLVSRAEQTASAATKPAALDITAIRHFPVKEPVSGNRYSLPRITTRSGLTGWGECHYDPAADRVRQAVFHWSGLSIMFDSRSRQHYDTLRAAGHGHPRALRGLGDRLLAVLTAILQSGKPYDASLRGISASTITKPAGPLNTTCKNRKH